MKKLKHLIYFLSITLLFTACSSDDDNNSVPDGEFRALVDGVLFVANGDNVVANYNYGVFTIVAVNPANGNQILITITDEVFEENPNTYSLTEVPTGGATFQESNGADGFVSILAEGGGAGELTITNFDLDNKLVSGNFNFVGVKGTLNNNNEIIYETVEVTEGAFNNIIINTESVSVGNSQLSATIDGTATTFDNVNAMYQDLLGLTTITITALNTSTNQNLAISFPGDVSVGTYSLGSIVNLQYTASYTPNFQGIQSTQYQASSGELIITNVNTTDKIVEGTFSFTAADTFGGNPETFEITEGSFVADYQ